MAKKKAPKKFIQKAIKKPGSLTTMAKAKGMSIKQFCEQSNLSTSAKKKCDFYENVLKPASKKRKKG